MERHCAVFLRSKIFFLLFQKISLMPVNRNALVRFKTIDACLRNRRKKWTLDMLIDAVSDALYEFEGISKGISRRTVQADIQMMRSNKLGYNAPIIIVDKKYYSYEDPEYSITNIPLNETDLSRMNEAVEVLKQFKGFSHFSTLNEVVQKLEEHVYVAAHKTTSIIDFEKNEQLKGLVYLDPLYQAIVNRRVVDITYQSFRARAADTFSFSIWWLKEFKNRWFAIGVKARGQQVLTLALDRMQDVVWNERAVYTENELGEPANYYNDVIGVTVSSNQRTQNVKILVTHAHAPYVITKPLHHSQQVLEQNEEGVIINIKVQLNYELEKEILGFGEAMTVLAPEKLKKRMQQKLQIALLRYNLK